MELSARNQLSGKIKNVRVEGLLAELVIDIGGQEIPSVITAGSAQRLRLAVGDTVRAIIKSTEVMVGK